MASVRDTNLKLYKATTRLNEFYAQPMQPSVSKFRAASDIDCSDYEELYRSANLFQTWFVCAGFLKHKRHGETHTFFSFRSFRVLIFVYRVLCGCHMRHALYYYSTQHTCCW